MGRKFFAILGVIVFAGVLGGCSANSVKLDGAAVSRIQQKRLLVQVNNRPKLIVVTAAKAMLSSGLMASLLMRGLSDDLANDFTIADPAKTVAARVRQRLVSKHAMKIATSRAHADIVLEVTNTGWEVTHGSLLNMTSYHPNLHVTAQLMEARSKKVLLQANCAFQQKITPWRGYEEILANKGAVLKADFNQLTAKCVNQILAKAF
ncbi:MAG: hypothetical protein L3J67_14115 [Hyphomicrobiaceae bacterium]|nr:hypothetical protein [Hyphomicrobiaceae bacterium]